MFGRFGWAEILIIVVLVVILFGHNKIPGMMKNLADGVNIFKKELKTTKTDNAKPAPKAAAKKTTAVKKATTKKTPAKKPTVAKKTVKKSASGK